MNEEIIDERQIEFDNTFKFRVVELNAHTKMNKKNKQVKLTYYLLVDEQDFIHDYKVQVEQFFINEDTTKGHLITKKGQKGFRSELVFRMKLLKYLGLDETKFTDPHERKIEEVSRIKKYELKGYDYFYATDNNKKDKISIFFNNKSVKELKVNQFLWDELDGRETTIRNSEYWFIGHNPKGCGDGSGWMNVDFYDETEYREEDRKKEIFFGFFTGSLWIVDEVKKSFPNISYEKYWNSFGSKYLKQIKCKPDNDNLDIQLISFDQWLNSKKDILRKYFKRFHDECNITKKYNKNKDKDEKLNAWKDIKEDFRSEMHLLGEEWMKLSRKVNKLRTKQKTDYKKYLEKHCKTKYDNYRDERFIKDSYEDFFVKTDNTPVLLQFAHIKPVQLIKMQAFAETMKEKREEILKQIADIKNFLPLSNDVHDLYDKNKAFYWDVDGRIKFCDKNYYSITKCYLNIKEEKAKECSKYLKEYINMLKEEHKI